MNLKTTCSSCGQRIEYTAEEANQMAPCPSCGAGVALAIPKPVVAEIAAPKKKQPKPKQMTCHACGNSISVNARACVHCGEPFQHGSAVTAIAAAIFGVVGGYLVLDSIVVNTENIMQQSYIQARLCFGIIILLLSLIAGRLASS